VRGTVLFAIVVGALIALLWLRPVPSSAIDPPQLSYVTTAHQLGVVGYRDPAGSISPDGKLFAYSEGRFIRVIPLSGGARQRLDPDVDVIGPLAFTKDRVYFASPADNGMVALWTADLRSKHADRISAFSRDAYAPSIGGDTVVFKTQTYRTLLADVPADGGATRQLTTFQSETPSYHPTQPLLAFTYGTWRRVLDDGKYPDIAQDIGVIDVSNAVPADAPATVIAKSESEDQAMAWSPNGRWIAFHSHREMSDDVWLRPSDGSAADKRITFLGRGAEAGWPRWSPNGRLVLISAGKKTKPNVVAYVIGIDQETGALTSDLREVLADLPPGDVTHAEWFGNDAIVAIAKEAPGRHAILTLPARGGKARIIHRFSTEHDFDGLGISAAGKYLAFTAPASDGYYQIFKMPVAGDRAPIQLTTDPSNKTQPAFAPDGSRVAFTVWSYDATFWSFTAR
jgi:Tol biopolymer transport system component